MKVLIVLVFPLFEKFLKTKNRNDLSLDYCDFFVESPGIEN